MANELTDADRAAYRRIWKNKNLDTTEALDAIALHFKAAARAESRAPSGGGGGPGVDRTEIHFTIDSAPTVELSAEDIAEIERILDATAPGKLRAQAIARHFLAAGFARGVEASAKWTEGRDEPYRATLMREALLKP